MAGLIAKHQELTDEKVIQTQYLIRAGMERGFDHLTSGTWFDAP